MALAQEVFTALQSYDDGTLVIAFTRLCAQRPELKERLVNGLQNGLVERYTGVIKKYDPSKGFGFIECAETYSIYGRDVWLHSNAKGDLEVGAAVVFSVRLNKSDQPQAEDVQDASGPPSGRNFTTPLLRPPAGLSDSPLGHFGKGAPMLAASRDFFGELAGGCGFGDAADVGGSSDGLARHLGSIKWFDAAKKFGFISSETITAEYGRDAFVSDQQIGSFGPGSTVSFAVRLNAQGHPQAQDLLPADGSNEAGPEMATEAEMFAWGDMPTNKRKKVEPLGGLHARPALLDIPPLSGASGAVSFGGQGGGMGGEERYMGVIKKFDTTKKFGFIECPEVQAMFGSDTFLSDRQIGPFDNGSMVSFAINVKNGKPQAFDLLPL